MPSVRIKRGTRAQIASAAAANGLKQGELYHVTDENRVDVGTGTGATSALATKSEVDGKEPTINAGTTDQYFRGDKTWSDFFTDVRATVLTGLSTATDAVITAADTALQAIGKLQAQITGHKDAASNAHPASTISNTPSGGIAATTVQDAINELDAEKASVASVREKLTAARTYYVRTDGNDSNSGLANTSGGAFLTIQKAVDVCAAIDLGIYDATIMVGAGTWTAATTLKTTVGAGKVIIRGVNDDMTSTVVHTTGASCFSGAFAGRYRFEWLRMQTTTAGYCISAFGGGAAMEWANVDFGPCASSHVACVSGARAESVGPCKISGNGYSHVAAYDNATLQLGAHTTTITGTPAMTAGFVVSGRGASVVAVGPSFSGTTAGPRYFAALNGTIITLAGETFLPGDTPGTKETGGQYA